MADDGFSNPTIGAGYGGYGSTNQLLAAASNSPQAASQWLGVAQQGQQLSQQQYELATRKFSALNGLIGSIITDPTQDNATQRIGDGIRAGIISPDDGARELQTISSFGNDPAKIKQYGFQHQQQNASIQQQLDASGMGAPQYVSNGQQQIPVVARSGLNPSISPVGGPSIQQYQTPADLAKPVDYTQNGNVVQSTQRGYQQHVGDPTGIQPTDANGNALSPYMAPPQPGAAESYSGSHGSGPARVPYVGNKAPPPPPNSGRSSPITYTAPLPGGGSQRTNAQGQAIGSNGQPTTAAANAPNIVQGGPTVPGLAVSSMLVPGREDYRADLNNSSAKMQGVQPLLSALPLIERLGQTGSGPGTKPWNDVKSFLVSQGVVSADATDVDIRDEANKYLKQYVAKSGIAQRSDMGTLVSEQSSPNLETSNKATIALTRNSIAQDRMEAARPLAYSSDDLSGYSKFKGGWTQSQDVRAYGLDNMPADQRASLLQSMAAKRNTPEGRKFFLSLQNAMAAKVVTPPNAPAGASNGQ